MCLLMHVCICIRASARNSLDSPSLSVHVHVCECVYVCTHMLVNAGLVHLAHEELQADDGVDDDDEEDQQGDMEQRNHGFDNGVQHYL